jgi:hypothetical protein
MSNPEIEQRLVAEEWKTIPQFPDYQASSLGRIRSVDRFLKDGRFRRGIILKPWQASGGYWQVSLGQSFKTSVHRLIAFAFHGFPPIDKNEVAHLNGNNQDNRPENLCWASKSENEAHKEIHGTRVINRVFKQPWHKPRGPKISRHPLADEITKRKNEGASLRELSIEFNMSKSGMHNVLKARL